jgi:hypothetical protein
MPTYKTFIRTANNFDQFAKARKRTVDTGLTLDEAVRQCCNFNDKARTVTQISRGTKMEFSREN